MSRKDHRRSIELIVDADLRSVLTSYRHVRPNGRKTSLADTVRKLVQRTDIDRVVPQPIAARGLRVPVQLPRKLHEALQAQALILGCSNADLLRGWVFAAHSDAINRSSGNQ